MTTQTVKVTKPGTIWDSLEAAIIEFEEFTDNNMVDAIIDYKSSEQMTSNTVLSEDGTTIVFTREWDDSAFDEFMAEFSNEISAHRTALINAGWTVDASE